MVNVALPAIEADLGGGLAGQQWVANAYLITLAALILISGSLADLFGERRVFVLGVAGFGVTSVLCAIAPSVEVLIAARALQGVSGALLTPSALAIIVTVFPESERGAAVGTWTAWSGIGILIGPLVGGQIVDVTSWRWIFAINVPLVLATLALAARAVPEGRHAGEGTRIDYVGAVLCAAGLAGVSFAFIQQPILGWSHLGILVPLIGGVAVFVAFVAWEARASHPMLPLGLFKRRNFAVGNIQTLAMYGGLAILGFFLTLYLQQVAGYSALKAGSVSLVPTVVMFLFSRRFGALADQRGPRLFMSVGPIVAGLGFVAMLRLDETVSFLSDLLPALLLFSFGLAMTVSPLTAAVLADADEQNAGIASATNNAIARTAGLLATAAVGAVVAASFSGSLQSSLEERATSPQSQAALEEARGRTLGEVDVAAFPAQERAAVAQANADASVRAFRLANGIAAALLFLAGLVAAVGLKSKRRPVTAKGCPGGSLAGAPEDAARERSPGGEIPASNGRPRTGAVPAAR